MGSADTGAREPQQDLVSVLTDALEVIAEEARVQGQTDIENWARAALAAGVGVPPDEDLVAHSAEIVEMRARAEKVLAYVEAGSNMANLARDVVALSKEVEELRAGVGEARPAEPPTETDLESGASAAREQEA